MGDILTDARKAVYFIWKERGSVCLTAHKAMSEKAKTIREPFFTPKRKKISAICSAAAVVLWLILWNIFPMEFYSLFFASLVGSNLLLAVLAAVITFPSNLICSKITRRDISAGIHLAADYWHCGTYSSDCPAVRQKQASAGKSHQRAAVRHG